MQKTTLTAPLPLGFAESVAQSNLTVETAPEGIYASDAAAVEALYAAYQSSNGALQAAQSAAIASVQAQFTSLVTSGFTYQGALIGILDTDRPNIDAKALQAYLSLQSGTGVTWSSNMAWLPQGPGSSLALPTAAAMIAFANAVDSYYTDIVFYEASLEAQIAAATSVAAVQAINVTTGWPTS